MESYPWCVVESDGNKVTFLCKHCEEQHVFNNTGMTIDRFVEKCESFCNLHKECE